MLMSLLWSGEVECRAQRDRSRKSKEGRAKERSVVWPRRRARFNQLMMMRAFRTSAAVGILRSGMPARSTICCESSVAPLQMNKTKMQQEVKWQHRSQLDKCADME